MLSACLRLRNTFWHTQTNKPGFWQCSTFCCILRHNKALLEVPSTTQKALHPDLNTTFRLPVANLFSILWECFRVQLSHKRRILKGDKVLVVHYSLISTVQYWRFILIWGLVDALLYQAQCYTSCSPSSSSLNNGIDYFHIPSPKTRAVEVSCFISEEYFNDPSHCTLANEKQVSKADFPFCRKWEVQS